MATSMLLNPGRKAKVYGVKCSTIENDSELQTQLRNTEIRFTQNTEFRDGLKEESSTLEYA